MRSRLFLQDYSESSCVHMGETTSENQAPPILKERVISPFKEMVAYEILWALSGMTEKRLSQIFQLHQDIPSVVLQKHKPLSLLGEDEEVANLRSKIEPFLLNKAGSFSVVVNRDFQYHEGLRDAKYPVELFYYKGNIDLLSHKRSVSIVGARSAGDNGQARAARLAKELVEHDFTIVSGLAKGIDTAAHTSAISAGGQTIAVIGTPIDQYYPKPNRELQDRIAQDYLLISQVPFYRYDIEHYRNHKFYFPRRNATMAALTNATIIVEASEKSGTLTQARACMDQGRKLFILDSCFENKAITWPEYYRKKGAIRVKSTKDILDNL